MEKKDIEAVKSEEVVKEEVEETTEEVATEEAAAEEAPAEEAATEVEETEEEADDEGVKALVNSKLDAVIKESGIKDSLEAYNKSLQTQSKEVLKANPTTETTMEKKETFMDKISKAVETFKAAGNTPTAVSLDIDLKDLSESGSITGEAIPADQELNVLGLPKRDTSLVSVVTSSPTSSNLVRFTEVTTETGAPASTAELAAIPAKDYNFQAFTSDVKKIAVHNKQSNEIVEDAAYLTSYVRGELMRDLELEVEQQIFDGDGVGTNLTGIVTGATAFAADANLIVADPNRFDALNAAAVQVAVGEFTPTHAFVNHVDVAGMQMEKGTDGQYVLPPFITAGGMQVAGLKIMATNLIAAGSFLVGDFSKSNVRVRRTATLEMSNSDQDDFIKDLITLRATTRLAHYVKANDSGAFVTGTFTAAIADLTS